MVRPYIPVIHRRKMYAAFAHQPAAKRQAFRRVVIAADDEDLHFPRRKLHQKFVKNADRLRGRHRFVVDIPCDQYRVRMLALRDLEYLIQYVPLVFCHGKSADPLADVQV